MQIKIWHLSTSTQNSTVIDESKSSLLLFDIVSTTFIPGKIRSILAELRAFYGICLDRRWENADCLDRQCALCHFPIRMNLSMRGLCPSETKEGYGSIALPMWKKDWVSALLGVVVSKVGGEGRGRRDLHCAKGTESPDGLICVTCMDRSWPK